MECDSVPSMVLQPTLTIEDFIKRRWFVDDIREGWLVNVIDMLNNQNQSPRMYATMTRMIQTVNDSRASSTIVSIIVLLSWMVGWLDGWINAS